MICVRKQKKTKLILILSKINPSLLASPILYVYVFLVFNVHDLSINVCHNSATPVSTILFLLFPFVHHYSHLLYFLLLYSSLLFSSPLISLRFFSSFLIPSLLMLYHLFTFLLILSHSISSHVISSLLSTSLIFPSHLFTSSTLRTISQFGFFGPTALQDGVPKIR